MNDSTPNLFTSTAFSEFKKNLPTVEKTTRTVIDHHVTILGHKFELEDLYETLTEIKDGDIVINNDKMVKVLKELGVLKSNGSQRWMSGATPGENYEEFKQFLSALYYASDL